MSFHLGNHIEVHIGRPQWCNVAIIHAGWFATSECISFELALLGFVLTVEYWNRRFQ